MTAEPKPDLNPNGPTRVAFQQKQLSIFHSLFRLWYWFFQLLALTSFMAGSFILGVTLVPLLRILPGNPKNKQKRIRGLIRAMCCSFVTFKRASGCMLLRVEGAQHLRSERPRLFVANHPTLFDIVVLLSQIPAACCLYKQTLKRHLFLRNIVMGAGLIPNDHPVELINACRDNFAAGFPLVVFPEGTRSPNHQLGRFTRGAAQIALRCQVDLVPVVITCDPLAFGKGYHWRECHTRSVRYSVRFLEPISVGDHCDPVMEMPIAARTLNRKLEDIFRNELAQPIRGENQ